MKHFTLLLLNTFLFTMYTSVAQKFPYKAEGLSERKAAEHLLSRFTFGVRSSDIDEAVKMGLEQWFEHQLVGEIADVDLQNRLESLPALKMTNREIVEQYPLGPQLRNLAIKEGLLDKNDIGSDDKEKLKQAYSTLHEKYGIQSSKELERQTVNQKIIRAIYSKNQLHEVLTDFWFNHFNVFMGKNQNSQFVLSYERDAIRPYVNQKFSDILLATAKSPAMLTYLDNFLSSSEERGVAEPQSMPNNRRPKGINENYAREVMELHTLGVDGGYSQDDVINAAKILTGWTIYPMRKDGEAGKISNMLEKIGEDRLASRGFVHEGDFLFAANRHEKGDKTVLGKLYNQGGYAEGTALLNDLAIHPSTASFICKKIATRFVSDQPDEVLLQNMTKTFVESQGDISKVLWTMVESREFWKENALHQKTKSPFEYAISAVRVLNADVKYPMPLANWITKMGQKVYYYQAPTGFPDNGQYWINTGSLLNRMNFGLDLANGKIAGIKVDASGLLGHKEPESSQEAIMQFGNVLLPERNIESTVTRLLPVINDPTFVNKIIDANKKHTIQIQDIEENQMKDNTMNENASALAQILGIFIGSPEFQRK